MIKIKLYINKILNFKNIFNLEWHKKKFLKSNEKKIYMSLKNWKKFYKHLKSKLNKTSELKCDEKYLICNVINTDNFQITWKMSI